MVSFTKIVTLLVRMFSKPAVTFIRNAQLQNRSPRLTAFFGRFGQWVHHIEYRINKALSNDPMLEAKPISAALAAQKGVEWFYQLVFYAIILGIPISEMVKSSRSNEEKEVKLNDEISGIEQYLNKIKEDIRRTQSEPL